MMRVHAYSLTVPKLMSSMLLSSGWRVRSVERTCSSVKAREPQSENLFDLLVVFDVLRGGDDWMRTCVMDHHDVCEAEKVVEGKYVVERGRCVSAHVAKYHSFWW